MSLSASSPQTTLSEIDDTKFLSAPSQSQTASQAISQADFVSAVGDGEDEMPGPAGSGVGDWFDIPDDPSGTSEARS